MCEKLSANIVPKQSLQECSHRGISLNRHGYLRVRTYALWRLIEVETIDSYVQTILFQRESSRTYINPQHTPDNSQGYCVMNNYWCCTPSSSHIRNSGIPGATHTVPTYILPVQIAYLLPKREASKIEGGKRECKQDYIFPAPTLQRPSNPTLRDHTLHHDEHYIHCCS